jgi:hypothetical protein
LGVDPSRPHEQSEQVESDSQLNTWDSVAYLARHSLRSSSISESGSESKVMSTPWGRLLSATWASSSAGSSCSLGVSRVQSEWAVTGFFHWGAVESFLGVRAATVCASIEFATDSTGVAKCPSGRGSALCSFLISCRISCNSTPNLRVA